MTSLLRTPERQRLGIVALLLLWSMTLLGFRLYRGFDPLTLGLFWNIFLASVPLLWSAAFQSATRNDNRVMAGVFFCLWLLFFPNAPYLLTDMIHLKPSADVPQWYMLAMLLSCAGTGVLLGYFSLLDIHATIENRFGKISGWSVIVGSLMLCAFGIYVGRFLRWNSWDALTHPLTLLKSVAAQFVNSETRFYPHPVPVTLIFGVGLIIGYLALRALMSPTVGTSPVVTSKSSETGEEKLVLPPL